MALQYCFKSGTVMPSALFFFLKTALAIQNPLWFYTNFRVIYSIPVKNATGILMEIALNL